MALRRVRRLAAHLASPPTPHLGVHSATAAATAAALPQHGQQASYPKRKVFACGAGPGADTPWLRDQIITATGKAEPTVLYMGTPSYDGREGAKGFAEAGLEVSWLNCTDLESLPDAEAIAGMIRGADIIQVSGGNTLFAVRRWRNLGVDKVRPPPPDRGPDPGAPRRPLPAARCLPPGRSCCTRRWRAALSSAAAPPAASAGSTAATPTPSHRGLSIPTIAKSSRTRREKNVRSQPPGTQALADAQTSLKRADAMVVAGSYCRVKGLGFIDMFCCPHHNQHESHSLVSRSEHFDSLLRLSPGEVGLGVDNQACFVV